MKELKSYAAKTDQGPYLQVNEDDQSVDLANKVYLVFDGFGGSNIGDKAVEEVKNNVHSLYTNLGGDPDSTLPFYYSHKYLLEGNALINAMYYAHENLKEKNASKEMSQRGGVAGICACQADNILTLVGTGNCLGLLYRKGEIETVISPDNYEYYSTDSYYEHFYSAPMSGFGLFDELHYTAREVKIFSDDVFLLLTDGIYTRLSRQEIKHILDKKISDLEKVDSLFRFANDRGNRDNQTCLLLHY